MAPLANPTLPKAIDERLWLEMIQALPTGTLLKLIKVQPLPKSEAVVAKFLAKYNQDCASTTQDLEEGGNDEADEQVALAMLGTGADKFPASNPLGMFKMAIYNRWPRVIETLLRDTGLPKEAMGKLKIGIYQQGHKVKVPVAQYLLGHAGGKIIDGLLESGLDVNRLDGQGRNAVFYARDHGVLQRLIKKGARIDVKDRNGDSAEVYWSKQIPNIEKQNLELMRQVLAECADKTGVTSNPQDKLESQIDTAVQEFCQQVEHYGLTNKLKGLDVAWEELRGKRFQKTIEGQDYSIHAGDFIALKILQRVDARRGRYVQESLTQAIEVEFKNIDGLFAQEAKKGETRGGDKSKSSQEKRDPQMEYDGFLRRWAGEYLRDRGRSYRLGAKKIKPKVQVKTRQEAAKAIKHQVDNFVHWYPLLGQQTKIDNGSADLKVSMEEYLEETIFTRMTKGTVGGEKNPWWLWENLDAGLTEADWRTTWGKILDSTWLAEQWLKMLGTEEQQLLPASQDQEINSKQYREWAKRLYETGTGAPGASIGWGAVARSQVSERNWTNAEAWMNQQVPWVVDKETKKWLMRRDRHVTEANLRRLFNTGMANWMRQTLPEAAGTRKGPQNRL